MIDKKFLIFGIIFLFCSIVSADIISVNSGGSKDIVITPDKYIEGFFSFVNNLPIASNLVLFSSSGLNTTNENLSISYDANDVDADIITNITDWRLNGNSIAVLNMPFDKNVGELTSGALRDYSTYANNATLGGGTKAYAPSWNSTCQVGGCYTFDGVDDYLDVPAVLSGKREFYMSLWVKSSGNLENTYGVLIGSIDSAWSSGDWMFFVRDTGKIVGYVRDNSNNAKRVENLSLTSIFDSSWHYIGFGFNGTHLFSVLDGEISLGESLTLSSIGSGQTSISKKGNAVD